jgi:hypothetical protein
MEDDPHLANYSLPEISLKWTATQHLSWWPPFSLAPLPDVVVLPCKDLQAVMVNVFSVPVFFVVFRETLESAIIISVLLGIVKRIANTWQSGKGSPLATEDVAKPERKKQNIESGLPEAPPSPPGCDDASSDQGKRKILLRKLRLQVCRSILSPESNDRDSSSFMPLTCA